jgi:hypothetical protein
MRNLNVNNRLEETNDSSRGDVVLMCRKETAEIGEIRKQSQQEEKTF